MAKSTPKGRTALNIHLVDGQYATLQRISDKEGTSKVAIIRQAIKEYLRENYPEYLPEYSDYRP